MAPNDNLNSDKVALAIGGQKKKQRREDQQYSKCPKKDISKITCSNYNKKDHLAHNCIKPKN